MPVKNRMNQLMQGAFVLTLASLIAKILSAIYRVPYQNLVGDEGFYAYQQVYPIYGLAMTLALSGLPQFISKIVAEQKTPKEQKASLKALYPFVLIGSVVLWVTTFVGANYLAMLMGDLALAPSIRLVAFAFLLIPALSFYRGAFQGNLMMIPTAVSQVAEQLIRVTIIIIAAVAFRSLGWDIYQTGTVAMSGALVGGLLAIFILYYYEAKVTGAHYPLWQGKIQLKGNRKLLKRLLVEGGLFTVYSGFLILFQLVDSFYIVNALQDQGMPAQTARVVKGIFDRGQPLVQLGLVVAAGMSASFLPALTQYLNEEKLFNFHRSAKLYLRITVGISAAAALGLSLLLPFVNYTLFKDNAGYLTLTIFVLAIFLMSVIQSYQSIAQSQNQFKTPVLAALIGLAVKFLTTYLFTGNWQTVGAAISTLLGLCITLAILMATAGSKLNQFWFEHQFAWRLFLTLLIMAVALVIYTYLSTVLFGALDQRLQALFLALGGVAVGAGTFGISAWHLKVFSLREWLMMPFIKKIIRRKR